MQSAKIGLEKQVPGVLPLKNLRSLQDLAGRILEDTAGRMQEHPTHKNKDHTRCRIFS